MYIDRFGNEDGSYVGIPRRPPTKKGIKPNNIFIPATFSERSLRSLSETELPFNISKYLKEQRIQIKSSADILIPDFRKVIYSMIYNKDNDKTNSLYYILRVLKPITAKLPCKAAPAFEYDGGALQVQLPRTIKELLEGPSPSLQKLSSEEIYTLMGSYFPPYSGPKIQDALFEPHDERLINVVRANYPYPKDGNRDRLRDLLGFESDAKIFNLNATAPVETRHTVVATKRHSMFEPITIRKLVLEPPTPGPPTPEPPTPEPPPTPPIKRTYANTVKLSLTRPTM